MAGQTMKPASIGPFSVSTNTMPLKDPTKVERFGPVSKIWPPPCHAANALIVSSLPAADAGAATAVTPINRQAHRPQARSESIFPSSVEIDVYGVPAEGERQAGPLFLEFEHHTMG